MRLFDDADCVLVPIGIVAVGAEFAFADVVAKRAESEFFLDIRDCLGETHGVFDRGAQDMEGQALGGFLSNAWEAFEFLNESG